MGAKQLLIWGGSEPIENGGEIMGTRRRVVLSKVVHARVSRKVYEKARSEARAHGLTVSRYLSKLLAEV